MKNTSMILPSTIEKLDNNTWAYRWNIREEQGQSAIVIDETQPATKLWSFDEIVVWDPITANKITERVIKELYEADVESKYINDYNGFLLGILDESYKEKYITFLENRKALKEEIDRQCEKYGIPKK